MCTIWPLPGLVSAKRRVVITIRRIRKTTGLGSRVRCAISAYDAEPASGTASQILNWLITSKTMLSILSYHSCHFMLLCSQHHLGSSNYRCLPVHKFRWSNSQMQHVCQCLNQPQATWTNFVGISFGTVCCKGWKLDVCLLGKFGDLIRKTVSFARKIEKARVVSPHVRIIGGSKIC